jgi:hypothetical protein
MRMRVLAPVAVVLVLVGCSTGRPGAAAVVDGDVITMAQVDEASQVICELSLAQEPGGSFPNDQIRGQAVTELALAVVAQEVAEREGLQVREGDVRIDSQDRKAIAASFPGSDTEAIVRVLETSTRVTRVAEALGSEIAGEELTAQNTAALQKTGRAALVEALGEADTEFSPRLDVGDLSGSVQQPRSLSVLTEAGSEDAESAAQPLLDTQTCA